MPPINLGKDVRTVQRWENSFGLPVRRPNSRDKGTVCASREELDHWLATHWSQKPKVAAPAAPNPTSVDADIQAVRELQNQHQQRVEELHGKLQILVDGCQTLVLRIAHAQNLLNPSGRIEPVGAAWRKVTIP